MRERAGRTAGAGRFSFLPPTREHVYAVLLQNGIIRRQAGVSSGQRAIPEIFQCDGHYCLDALVQCGWRGEVTLEAGAAPVLPEYAGAAIFIATAATCVDMICRRRPDRSSHGVTGRTDMMIAIHGRCRRAPQGAGKAGTN